MVAGGGQFLLVIWPGVNKRLKSVFLYSLLDLFQVLLTIYQLHLAQDLSDYH